MSFYSDPLGKRREGGLVGPGARRRAEEEEKDLALGLSLLQLGDPLGLIGQFGGRKVRAKTRVLSKKADRILRHLNGFAEKAVDIRGIKPRPALESGEPNLVFPSPKSVRADATCAHLIPQLCGMSESMTIRVERRGVDSPARPVRRASRGPYRIDSLVLEAPMLTANEISDIFAMFHPKKLALHEVLDIHPLGTLADVASGLESFTCVCSAGEFSDDLAAQITDVIRNCRGLKRLEVTLDSRGRGRWEDLADAINAASGRGLESLTLHLGNLEGMSLMDVRGILVSKLAVMTTSDAEEAAAAIRATQALCVTLPKLDSLSIDAPMWGEDEDDTAPVSLNQLPAGLVHLRVGGPLVFQGDAGLLPNLRHLEIYCGSYVPPEEDGVIKILRAARSLQVLDCNCWSLYDRSDEDEESKWDLERLLPSVRWMFVDAIIDGSVPNLTHLCILHDTMTELNVNEDFGNVRDFIDSCDRLTYVCLPSDIYAAKVGGNAAKQQFPLGTRTVTIARVGSFADVMTPKRANPFPLA